MTRECDLETASHHRAVHGRKHRHAERFEIIEEQPVFDFLRRTAELSDVGAGEEGAALASQDDGADVTRRANTLECGAQACAHVGGNRVDRGIVNDDERQLTVALDAYDFRRHRQTWVWNFFSASSRAANSDAVNIVRNFSSCSAIRALHLRNVLWPDGVR